jgi:deazaflavin-dependent oxidoreductase (nitroreductase family)
VNDFNNQVINEFRANNGHVASFGSNLVLIHTIGAKTGEPRVNPAMSIKTSDGWLVIASAAGREKNPGWFHNLMAHPQASIETAEGQVDVTATRLAGDEYARAWQQFTERSSAFAVYQEKAGKRVLPILRLSPR